MSFLRVALAGNPNCGKTALFNALTGGRQKVGNYPGVTVERKEGVARMPGTESVLFVDLPGTYSLEPRTLDEQITRDFVSGQLAGEDRPQVIVAVADATNLERNLGLVLELKQVGIPIVLAVNMIDLAEKRGMKVDYAMLGEMLGVPVVTTVAVQKRGIKELVSAVTLAARSANALSGSAAGTQVGAQEVRERFAEVDRILKQVVVNAGRPHAWTDRIDRVVLHPVWGLAILVALLGLMFQGVFNWASAPADFIEGGVKAAGETLGGLLGPGLLHDLWVDGIVAGVGSVVVFLPQILLLFAFILLLEDSGYMARAAFLMDRVMGKVGLHGRAFIPLLSSYACAIPGIMATRTIENRRDRLTTVLVAPLTTCSARLPVYTLLIGAFIPNREVVAGLRLQGLVMFALYVGGAVAALTVAWVLKKFFLTGETPPLLLEMPSYKVPSLKGILLGIWERSRLFLRRAGTVILTLSIIIWFLSSFPKAPEGATGPAIDHSFAGRIGHTLEPLVRPIGFDWRIAVAMIPGFAAREVMVSALGTVYAVEAADEDATAEALGPILVQSWSLATALSLLVWYVFACQCLSTLAVARRETNSWKWPTVMLLYMTALAYGGSLITYHWAVWMGWGAVGGGA